MIATEPVAKRLPTPTNLNANTVIMLAAENCPRDDA